jgi:type IX secretion system PorP/SprF family membrane protein
MIKMKKTFKMLGCSMALLLTVSKAEAQVDPHFSMYYVYPAWVNPALTGIFDGDFRVSGIYRTQWGNISTPYNTMGVAGDITTDRNANFGMSILNQTAGDGGYNYSTVYGSAAFTGLRFGPMESKRVVFGMQIGMIQRRFNPEKLKFFDGFNPATGNYDLPTADVLANKNNTAVDVAAGIFYYDAMPGRKANFFGGASVTHLTRPKDKFSSADGQEVIPVRSIVHGGVRIALNETVSLTPNVLYMQQGSASEKMIGAYAQYKMNPQTDLIGGINYRIQDAIAPFVGFTHKSLMLGVSYDVNTSDLGKIVKGSNSFEITLSHIGRKSTKTPEVEFICPRL